MTKKNGGGNDTFEFEKLQLKSAFAEFEEFVKSKVHTAERLGDQTEVSLYLDALELGRKFLTTKIGGLQ